MTVVDIATALTCAFAGVIASLSRVPSGGDSEERAPCVAMAETSQGWKTMLRPAREVCGNHGKR